MTPPETIAAIATPPGRGGVGIIRISGPNVPKVAHDLLGKLPKPRQAQYRVFRDEKGAVLDEGLALYFPGPNSYTGEDVLELQGHGGPVIQDCLLQAVLKSGARIARPGEFSERAFLNHKLDLAQAEAVADLINASSEQAARAAMRSLQGEFSNHIQQLVSALIQLRVYVEAAIDFPEEEIDFLSDGKIAEQLFSLLQRVQTILATARQGSLLQEGMTLVIAGPPNAGKSSLLNALSGRDVAIVTDIPGTTRDILRDKIQIDGMPLHIMDTAGLRESGDVVEQEGIRRAQTEIARADRVLWVVDAATSESPSLEEKPKQLTVVYNKIDLINETPRVDREKDHDVIYLSAKTGAGMELLRTYLKACVGFQSHYEGGFSARRRHLHALERCEQALIHSEQQLIHRAGELVAEDLRVAQACLNEITGEFSSEDLLGEIFSSFCIGK